MVYDIEYVPFFRDADANGRVGLRGYLNYFQDSGGGIVWKLGKGNDKIPEKYGASWFYTKYKIHINKEADFDAPVKISSWGERIVGKIAFWQGVDIVREEERVATGRLEACVFNHKEGKLAPISFIEYPEDTLVSDRHPEVDRFTRGDMSVNASDLAYTHKVTYTEIDLNRHMTNLAYIPMLINAYDKAFYDKYRITDFEIHYLSQCYEGEDIDVYIGTVDGRYYFAAKKKDGTVAAQAVMEVVER